MNEYLKTNQSLWDQKTQVHKDSDFYDMDAFKQGASTLKAIEREGLGDVAGKKVLHLQCHFGQDTMSLARLGAKVTGVDFSSQAIQLARSLNEELGLDARFIECNVLELPQHLDEKFDLIFTSYGVITWLPDLRVWASVIDHFLRPSGTFYIAEFHPTLYMFDFPTEKVQYNYFNSGTPYEEVIEGTYAAPSAPIQHKEYFWTHSLAEIINPLLERGLRLDVFKEFPYSPYHCFENMVQIGPEQYRFSQLPCSIPHVFSLKMTK